jgi:CrcB protein
MVGLGGFFGSVCRYLISLIPLGSQSSFPYTTLCINIAGAFLIGLISGLTDKAVMLHPDLLPFLRAGFCGGFTTFSTFALELNALLETGQPMSAVLYIALSTGLGLGAVFAGKALLS